MDFPSGGRGMISRSDSASWVVDVIKKATGNTHMCGGELCISTTPELVTEQVFEFSANLGVRKSSGYRAEATQKFRHSLGRLFPNLPCFQL